MKTNHFIYIFLAAYLATFLRLSINNNFHVSIIGSFLYGFVFSRKISKLKKEILLTGFCSCFTSYSGFINFLYHLINQGNYLKLFLCLNLVVILNLVIMYVGFLLSRKMI